MMKPVHVVEILTPKRYVLNGFWLGPKKSKRVIVWVHGLGSSMFSKLEIAEKLVDKNTAVLLFNNRGHDKVTSIKRANGTYLKAGAAHEVFTDSRDDIQGAVNFAKRNGAKDVYIAGHSTGCQKSIYYASKQPRGIRGIIILAPVSDYSAELFAQGKKVIARAESVARSYIKKGKKDVMLPEDVWRWPWIADAQRFISLYSGKGAEEIFTYWNPEASPRTLQSVRIPTLVFLAEKDEFSDISAQEIAAWFEDHLRNGRVVVVPRVKHSFHGAEERVAKTIRQWMR